MRMDQIQTLLKSGQLPISLRWKWKGEGWKLLSFNVP